MTSLYATYRNLRAAFRAAFGREEWRDAAGELTPAARGVLAELHGFCRANASTFDPDPRTHALLEGRREVWLRICALIHLTDAELLRLVDADNPEDQPKDAKT